MTNEFRRTTPTAPTQAVLAQAISCSQDIHTWMGGDVGAECGDGSSDAAHAGLALVQHAMDLADATTFLVQQGHPGPALALCRPMLEAFVRGWWFCGRAQISDATEAKAVVEDFRKSGHQLGKWSIGVLYRNRKPHDPTVEQWLDGFFNINRTILNDLVHGGWQHILGRVHALGVEPRYTLSYKTDCFAPPNL